MKVIISMIVLGLSLVGLAACNTVEGFGEDLQSAGRSVEKAAK